MTTVRSVLLAVVLVVVALFAPANASAIPIYDGTMSFPEIGGPEGGEEYTWAVQLDEEQELVAIDDQHAAVVWENGPQAFSITATLAHDANGATVPTTIAVIQPNLITLTVHHRAGNPAAAGAPFHYPVVPGAGYEGGFQAIHVSMPPAEQTPAPTCIVPDLSGRTVKASRRMLNRANCALGPVRGERSRGARVVRQYRAAGKSLPLGTEVGVKVLRP